jgi:hypothetical protein
MAIKYKNKLEIAGKEVVILPRLPPKLRTLEVGVTEEGGGGVPHWWPSGVSRAARRVQRLESRQR